MENLDSIDAALDFAIAREQEAADFYAELAKVTENPALQKTLTALVGVEMGHKSKLQAAKAGEAVMKGTSEVVDLKIGDYLVDVIPTPQMSYQDLLIVAIKREKAAMDLYNDLAARVSDASLQTLFKQLAREESTHKLNFETAYDEHFLSEN